MHLTGEGIHVELPPRWEGTIGVARGLDADTVARRRAAAGSAPSLRPTAHLGNFALPAERGEFGSGAVEVMGADHAFVALVEFGHDEVGTPLFARDGVPRRVDAGWFHPRNLQRTIAGHSGLQAFASEAGRAFCLYVVLGRQTRLQGLLDEVNQVLSSLTVAPR